MSAKTICILSQSHLCRNPRVLKESLALAQAGYVVKILTAIYSNLLLEEDLVLLRGTTIQYTFYSDLRYPTFSSFKSRLIRRLSFLCQQTLALESASSLGYQLSSLMKKSRYAAADLYICHQELATWAGCRMLKLGYRVAFDLEDWYSEDLLPETRHKRPLKLLRTIEATALKRGVFVTTTSMALSHNLAAKYLSKPPAVIYNVFPSVNALPVTKQHPSPIKLFWFSQTIGPGRGLENFIRLLANFKLNVELHLLGAVDRNYKARLIDLTATHHKICFHPLVPENRLAEKIAGFDVGLALELTTPASRNFTITNKFFQYIQAGLPVIASETEGQNEAFKEFRPGFQLPQKPALEHIIRLERWLNNPDELQAARRSALKAAEFYNWENESRKLLLLVNQAIEK